MTSYQQIKDDITVRIKQKERFELSVLRLVASKIERIGDKTDEVVLSAIKSELKEMNQTLEAFQRQAPTEEALAKIAAQKAKIEFLEGYLPKQLDADGVEEIVRWAIAQLDNPNIGSVMKTVKLRIAEIGTDADLGLVSQEIRKQLK